MKTKPVIKTKQTTISLPLTEHARLTRLARANRRSLSSEIGVQLEIAAKVS